METALLDSVGVFSTKYEKAYNKLVELFGSMQGVLRLRMHEAASIFRGFSSIEQKDAKRRLCKQFPFLSPVTFDWMVLVGDGVASDFWLEAKVRPPVKLFKALPVAARVVMNNPEKMIAVAGDAGVRAKKVRELTWAEMTQVLDPKKGVLPPEKQHVVRTVPTQIQGPRPRQGETLLFDSLVKKGNGNVEVFGRPKANQPGEWTVKVVMTAAEWKRYGGK